MKDIIAAMAIVVILTLAVFYIIKQKKKGVKCIGCPSSHDCPYKNKECNK